MSIRGGPAWIKVWVDGELEGPLSGRVYSAGRTITFTGKDSIEVRTGSSGSTHFTLNGVSPRDARAIGRAGDVAVRATRRTGQDAADVAVPSALVALAERLQGICLGRGLTVALAESCTGGLVASTLTEVAGSSGYFLGGVVSYSNEAKTAFLDVPTATLDAHGAVSAQVAKAMAAGAHARFGASLAASITGVAGPDGGTAREAGRPDVRRARGGVGRGRAPVHVRR